MAKITLPTISSGYATNTQLNEAFDAIEAEFQNKVLYRNNTSGEANQMENSFDMNSNRILNLPEPLNGNEAARLTDVNNALAGGAANLITATPYSHIAATTVQGFLQELTDEKTAVADLASTASGKGAALIGRGAPVVSSITALRALLKTSAAQHAFVTGYYTQGDGGGGAYWYDSSDTTSADNGGTIIVATDGGRWKLQHFGWWSVKQFGAKGDGAFVDTTFIQAANDALPATGGRLYFPGANYVCGAVALNKSATYWGDGINTKIYANSTTADIFTVSGAGAIVDGFNFLSQSPRTAGKYVKLTASSRLQRFWMNGAFEGVEVATGVVIATIQEGSIRDTVASTGVCIRVSDGVDISIRDITTDNDVGAMPSAGITVTQVGDLTIEDCNIIHCGTDLNIDAATGKVVASVWCNNTFFDTATRGAIINCSGGSVVRTIFDQCWFASHTADGVLISGSSGSIDGIEFNGCHFFLNATNGAQVSTTLAKNITFNGGAAAENAQNGLLFGANVGEFAVLNMRIGNSHGLNGNATGILVTAGTGNNYRIIGNDLRGNTGTALSNSATGTTCLVADNTGVNPGGTGGITVTASPFTYTAGATPETVYINGGTVSLVTVDGVAVFQQTNCTVRLSPKKAVVVTYTVAPGMAKTID